MRLHSWRMLVLVENGLNFKTTAPLSASISIGFFVRCLLVAECAVRFFGGVSLSLSLFYSTSCFVLIFLVLFVYFTFSLSLLLFFCFCISFFVSLSLFSSPYSENMRKFKLNNVRNSSILTLPSPLHIYCSFMQNARFVRLLLKLKDIKSEKQKCAGKLQKNQTNDRITQVKPNEIVYQAR